MKSNLALAAVLLCAAATAHAGFLDDLGRVADTVKKGTSMLPVPSGTPNAGTAGSGGMSIDRQPSNANTLLPLDLTAFPRSHLQQRVDNPFDRVKLLVSVPVKTPDGYIPPYSVPMEGKVTMLQFTHRSDDSPLLIREHYEAWLAQQGFERLLVCEAPCHRLPNQWDWRHAVDPTERLDSNYIPDQPTYVAAYKPDAMAIVGIGKHGSYYTSLVKVVEGRVLDPQPWKTVTAPKAPIVPVALSKSAPVAAVAGTAVQDPAQGQLQKNGEGPAADKAPAGIEIVTPDQLAGRLAQIKGIAVVQFSSTDKGCPFCVQSNPRFETLAQAKGPEVTFLRVLWQPYTLAFDDRLAIQYGLSGLPTFLTFKNGQAVRRVNGNYTVVELNSRLLADLK